MHGVAADLTPTDPPPAEGRDETAPGGRRGVRALALALLALLLIRLVQPGQPIVENYAGRQVPTAMVARNLERGSGFFRPILDTAPFPNYFLVEPPVYQAAACGLRGLTGWGLEPCGRAISALAMVLGALGLHGLVVRREGERVALPAVFAFGLLPVTIRYGRSFQPDALMLGLILIGLDCWDRAERGGTTLWRVAGWLLLAIGFAAKVTGGFVLGPLWFAILSRRSPSSRPSRGSTVGAPHSSLPHEVGGRSGSSPPPSWGRVRVGGESGKSLARCLAIGLLAASALLPALLWYAWADRLLETGGGSAASAANRSIWLKVVGLSALASAETLGHLGRFLLVRSFTPLGLALGCWGLLMRGCHAGPAGGRDIWKLWAGTALLLMAMLAAKLHHEYYWLVLAPPVAVGMGRAWRRLSGSHRAAAWACAGVFAAMSVVLSLSTYRTPPEWRHLEAAAAAVRRTVPRTVPPGALLVAPEPLLYQADFRGCRLEYTESAARRAAEEWRVAGADRVGGPLDLIAFYRTMGAGFLADVAAGPSDSRREDLHRLIRGRYKVLVESESVLIVELNP
ncbi:MAG: glycosyltransferase family 39 protein [Isosphaeraceae bacterium]